MLFPHSHAWTRAQKWLITAAGVFSLAALGALIYSYERYHRGPTEAAFVGTWEVTLEFSHIVMPSGAPLYYEFRPDRTYRLFGMTPELAPNERDVLETGTWYAGGDFIYLRLPWEQASYTALVPWHIDSMSPNEVQLHVGSTRAVFKRVSARSPSASNQALERTADRREDLFSMTSILKREAQLALISGRSASSR